jgi:hypothetical protein
MVLVVFWSYKDPCHLKSALRLLAKLKLEDYLQMPFSLPTSITELVVRPSLHAAHWSDSLLGDKGAPCKYNPNGFSLFLIFQVGSGVAEHTKLESWKLVKT